MDVTGIGSFQELATGVRKSLDEVAESALAKALGVPANPAQSKLVDEYISQRVLMS